MVTDKYELLRGATFTFKNDGTITEEEVMVAITGNETVGLGAAEGKIFGKAWVVEDRGTVMVQYDGVFVAQYSGTEPSAGAGELVLDGTGKVKIPDTAGTGTPVDILTVDAGNTAVAFVLR